MQPKPFLDASTFAVILTLGGSCLVGLVAIVGGFLHSRRNRMLAHAERMKALEMGRELPEESGDVRSKALEMASRSVEKNGPRSLALQVCSNTAWASGSGFFFAFLTASDVRGGVSGVGIAIAAAAGAIGVTGMICATVLAGKALARDPAEGPELYPAKPIYDPEAV